MRGIRDNVGYKELREEATASLLEHSDDDVDRESYLAPGSRRKILDSLKYNRILVTAFVFAITANLALTSILFWPSRSSKGNTDASEFAGLKFDQDIAWNHYTPYATTNLTEAGKLWDNIDWDSGFVALDYTYAEEHGLPKAQPFPWDQSKGIYLINAYHNLHCLKSIHQFIRELVLADDTPRYTPAGLDHFLESGVGQPRKCRDFSKLEAWAREHHSCYGRIDELHQCQNQMERYKFCPEGSPYQDLMHEYFRVVLGQELPPVVPKEAGKAGRCNVDEYLEELRAARTEKANVHL